jgi:hypothetical protein
VVMGLIDPQGYSWERDLGCFGMSVFGSVQ